MKIRRTSPFGQSVVETVLILPLLLILLGGGYWFYRNLSLSSSAESAAHAQMLRAGRRLRGIEPRLSGTIHPGEDVARIEAHNDPLIGEVPLFRGLAGRTTASADVSLGKEPVGAFLDLPSHAFRRTSEGAVDCWGKGTPSGSTVRGTVQGFLLTGVLR
ncbi:MAG TPA: TadE/TadG family type IV pilus assembly protein [Candidatus Deferrimicrobium sp.]|nr:TadE/TadG family type IV pilus assembly protein [Candidatus Deferrimicrobium sp.]